MATTANGGQRMLRTAYLGPEASFSHQAAVEALPNTKAIPLPSFKAILQALQNSPIDSAEAYDYAVLPVENSTNGSVVQALDLVAQCGLDPINAAYPDLEVIDEYYLEVHHCLFVSRVHASQCLSELELAILPIVLEQPEKEERNSNSNVDNVTNAAPSGSISRPDIGSILGKLNIRTMYTHPQVWGQCNNILSAYLPPDQLDRVDMSSTSAAAALIASNTATSTLTSEDRPAAISSSLAGAKHSKDLACIAQNIEDDPGSNTTRFLVLRNMKREFMSRPMNGMSQDIIQAKSLWVFTIAHFVPGSLATTLAVFAKHDFNLSAIQSRPRPDQVSQKQHGSVPAKHQAQDRNWRYIFFVECFHQRPSTILHQQDHRLAEVLAELKTVTEQITLLGSWKDRLS